ncbi:hypothetical protein N431DRAFT_414677 [Stipitochalara longipes BDJ]|nr:hypothetical protein N431DRAFT_414677 [Stipitochalara longipes BDJ]
MEADSLIAKINNHKLRRTYYPHWNSNPWILSTLFFAIVSVILFAEMRIFASGTYNTGVFFETDLGSAYPAMELEAVRYRSSPRFYENGTMYLPHTAGEPQYSGPPTLEIDRAWDELYLRTYGDQYFKITDEEGRRTWGDTLKEYYNDLTRTTLHSLDVMHTLHCVISNLFRTNFSDKIYKKISTVTDFYEPDHCVDHVRQAVQCYGDMTPVPTRWWDGLHGDFSDSDQVHTC